MSVLRPSDGLYKASTAKVTDIRRSLTGCFLCCLFWRDHSLLLTLSSDLVEPATKQANRNLSEVWVSAFQHDRVSWCGEAASKTIDCSTSGSSVATYDSEKVLVRRNKQSFLLNKSFIDRCLRLSVVVVSSTHTAWYVTIIFGGKWHNLVKVKSFCR
jgi:hypothetical protein